jgi:hypothetical protein
MKYGKSKLLTLIASAMALLSCNNGQPTSTLVEVGFNEYYGSTGPTCQVGLAFTAHDKQPLNATFDVYVGARKGFAEDWQNDLWECNPGYGKFAINRVIEDETGDEILSDFIILNDFPNDEKYPLTYETIEGTTDGVIMHYAGFIVNTFDFSTIDISKGSIGYYICYYDDINQKPFEGDYYLYGISWGGKLNFEKNDEIVIFSK